ncbi:stage V sporulation protein B [Oceanobacillus sp. E9]|uniref:stage V sporulation protein B n=1 Tax=Oceanobacillus TaxID=182709 RepID=UPI000347B98E|nr:MULTISPECIES: stage V sporulation protein B [Oceanobacillus]OEH55541.1 stage V sporulation protein B [Oceanobacillus sp. E9]
MTKQSFLQGAIILIVAGMITRFMGFINRIVVARLMGEEGVGLYMMALPTLFLVMTLTQFGLPVAISKRVAEADAQNDQQKIKKIVVVSLAITLSASIVFTAILILIAPLVASTLLTDERVMVPLIVISPIIPIAAVSAVLRGYFQGKQNMTPQSVAQVIEQIVRIICVALFIQLLLPYGVEYAAAGAMFSVILGEFISLLYMVRKFKRKRTIKVRNNFFKVLADGKQTAKDLFSISIPTLGSRMIGSFSNFLDPILVVQSLALAGVTATVATKQYGELTGYAMPLLFLPTFITSSLSIALVPSIAEAEANKQIKMIHNRIHQSIRISFASGAISTVVLTIFATEILTYMYGSSSASKFLLLMAPFFLFLYIQAPLQSALQALDLARPAMWNSLIGMGMKFLIMILFASNPSFGILGAAMAICVSVVIVTLLHLAVLKKNINYMIPFIDFVKMIVLVGLTFGIGYSLKQIMPNLDGQIIIFGALLIVLLLIYILLLFILKFITKQELQQIPLFRKNK